VTLFSTDYVAENARFSNEDGRTGTNNTTENFFVPAANTQEPTEFLVPAQIISQSPPSGAPPPAKKDKRHGHGTGHKLPKGGNFMDDYFNEGEKKSREVDFAPSAKNTPPPPPPKAKGPPPKAGGTTALPAKVEDDTGDHSGVD
jgi:hypothetical protein